MLPKISSTSGECVEAYWMMWTELLGLQVGYHIGVINFFITNLHDSDERHSILRDKWTSGNVKPCTQSWTVIFLQTAHSLLSMFYNKVSHTHPIEYGDVICFRYHGTSERCPQHHNRFKFFSAANSMSNMMTEVGVLTICVQDHHSNKCGQQPQVTHTSV